MALAAPAPDDHVVLLARERATAARSRPRRKPRRGRAKPAPARSARRAPAPAASPARPLVLIVEDHVDTRLMYAEYLRFTGLTVTEARDALTGVAKAIALRPNVIVMDLMLPGVDGWEAIR